MIATQLQTLGFSIKTKSQLNDIPKDRSCWFQKTTTEFQVQE